MRLRLGSASVVALVAVALAGCTQREGPPPELNVTTTTRPPTSTTVTGTRTSVSALPGLTPAQITASLDAAVSARDFCAFSAALDGAVPDVGDGQAVTSTYQALDRAVHAAGSFVPAALAVNWPVVVTGVDEGLAAARRVGGNLSDPSLRAPFTAGDFESAMSSVESWADTHCSS